MNKQSTDVVDSNTDTFKIKQLTEENCQLHSVIEHIQAAAPSWVSVYDEFPTDESCMYWVLLDGDVQMMHLNAYKVGSLVWTKWQGFDGNDVSIRNTRYIKIDKPAAPEVL